MGLRQRPAKAKEGDLDSGKTVKKKFHGEGRQSASEQNQAPGCHRRE